MKLFQLSGFLMTFGSLIFAPAVSSIPVLAEASQDCADTEERLEAEIDLLLRVGARFERETGVAVQVGFKDLIEDPQDARLRARALYRLLLLENSGQIDLTEIGVRKVYLKSRSRSRLNERGTFFLRGNENSNEMLELLLPWTEESYHEVIQTRDELEAEARILAEELGHYLGVRLSMSTILSSEELKKVHELLFRIHELALVNELPGEPAFERIFIHSSGSEPAINKNSVVLHLAANYNFSEDELLEALQINLCGGAVKTF